jgi:dCMP deaminase
MNWDEYGVSIAEVVSKKSKDPWRQVGAVILREDNSIASVGYNGFPQGQGEDWSDREERRKYVIHAEQNALRYLKPGEGRTLCSTLLPCRDCLRSIAAYQIKRIVYKDIYENDPIALEIADKMGVEIVRFQKVRLTSYWDHSQKPSAFVVMRGKEEVHRGDYKIGARMMGL